MDKPLEITLERVTGKRRAIGKGEPSGPGGQWRVFDILTDAPLRVFYPGAIYGVQTRSQWQRLPDEGLQVIAALGGVWKGADEYRYKGESPKSGLYLPDKQFEEILRSALG